jgi:hypothetical protein
MHIKPIDRSKSDVAFLCHFSAKHRYFVVGIVLGLTGICKDGAKS